MTRNEWLRIKSIAAEALEQPEPARPSFVASRCGTEVELRREVESLIDSTTKASQLYEAPTLLIASASAALDAPHQDSITTSQALAFCHSWYGHLWCGDRPLRDAGKAMRLVERTHDSY